MMNRPNYYLVDTENVGNAWMQLLAELHTDDRILLFYTKNSSHYSLDEMQMVFAYVSQIKFVKCTNGRPNALDFQLCAAAGYLYRELPDADFTVVSSDQGFDSMIGFLGRMGMSIVRRSVKNKCVETVDESKKKLSLEEKLKTLFPDEPETVQWMVQMFGKVAHHKGNRQVMVNNYCQKKFHDEASKYYRKLRGAGLLSKL